MKSKRDIANLESGKISRTDAAGTLCSVATCAKSPVPKRRGRPKSEHETDGMKHAREYFEALVLQGLKPTVAARVVARKWSNIPESAVFRDARQYQDCFGYIFSQGIDNTRFRSGKGAIDAMYEVVSEKLPLAVRKAGGDDYGIRKIIEDLKNDYLLRHRKEVIALGRFLLEEFDGDEYVSFMMELKGFPPPG